VPATHKLLNRSCTPTGLVQFELFIDSLMCESLKVSLQIHKINFFAEHDQ
jgi:hypothetical protein